MAKDAYIVKQIRKAYGKDVAFRAYVAHIKELEFELGQLKSHCAELEYEKSISDERIEFYRKKAEDYKGQLATQSRRIQELRKEVGLEDLRMTISKLTKNLREANEQIAICKLHHNPNTP